MNIHRMRQLYVCFYLFLAISFFIIPRCAFCNDEFEQAIKKGDLKKINSLLSQAPNLVNFSDPVFMTVLDTAVSVGRSDVVSLILSKVADPNIRMRCDGTMELNGFAPLHFVGIMRDQKAYDSLISKGAKPDIFSECAIGRKNEVVKILKDHPELLDSGICGNGTPTPIHFAAMGGQVGIIKYLVAKGAKTYPDFHEAETPIQWAARFRRPETVRYFLFIGADVNAMDRNNVDVPLSYAVANNDLATARILLAWGANPNWGHNGYPLLLDASYHGYIDICDLLIHYGAKVNGGNIYDITPLHEAANPQVAALLLSKGAKLNTIERWRGCNPFMRSLGGRPEVAKFLLRKGADINNHCEGFTALTLAAQFGHTEICRILIARGAPINLINNEVGWPGYAPLHFAIIGGHLDTVKLLLDHGAKVNWKDKDGNTPLTIAEKRGEQSIADLIKKYGGVTGDPTEGSSIEPYSKKR